MRYYAALCVSITLNAISAILLKSYAMSQIRRLFNLRLILSVAAYGFAALFWFFALFGVDLMVAYPSLALTYVIIGLVAPRMFAEELSSKRWIGIILIVAGVVVMNV